jgi:hypothetical protein
MSEKERITLVLYHSTIPVYLGMLLLHRLTINEKNSAVLIVDKKQFLKRNIDIEALSKRGIFDRVIFCDAYAGHQKKNGSVMDIEAAIVSQYDSVLLKYGFTIKDFDKIYTTNDWFEGEFNVYLSLTQTKFYWLELSKDIAKKHHTAGFPFQKFKSVSDVYAEVMRKHFATCPDGEYATPVLLEESERSKKYYAYKAYELWKPDQLQEALAPQYAKDIVKTYGDFANLDSNSVLLLRMNDAWASGNRPVEDQDKVPYGLYIDLRNPHYKMIYADTLALDYYVPLGKKLYIKPHPASPMSTETAAECYGSEAESLGIVPFQMLSKYLQSIGFKFDAVLGYGSTANQSSILVCDNSILLSRESGNYYWDCYFLYNSLFVSLQFAKSLSDQINAIWCTEVMLDQCQALEKWVVFAEKDIKRFRSSRDFPDQTFVIIDRITKKSRQAWLDVLNSSSQHVVFNILDVSEDPVFYDKSLRPFLVPIRIKKNKLKEDTLDPCRDETIWIFSKDEKVREMARNFFLQKTLPRLGVRLDVGKMSVSEIVDLFDAAERARMEIGFSDLMMRYNMLYESIKSSGGNDVVAALARNETDFSCYMDLLSILSKDFLIVIAVKDTLGNYLSEKALQKIELLGLTKFNKELWRTYIGVINRGGVVFETLGEREEPSFFNFESPLDDLTISVVSKSWKNGNAAEIRINDVDYAVNVRGLNIVVYDLMNKRLIDSSSFDAHEPITQFGHKRSQ